jgi:hypothetical protein
MTDKLQPGTAKILRCGAYFRLTYIHRQGGARYQQWFVTEHDARVYCATHGLKIVRSV